MSIIKKAVLLLTGLGIAFGMARYLGDGAALFSAEWFESASSKFGLLQDFGSNKFDEVVPDPESVTPDLNLETNQ